MPKRTKTTSLDAIAKRRSMEDALERARKAMFRETLEETRSGDDFFETNVVAVRDLVGRVFEAAYAEGLHAGYRQGRADACRETNGEPAQSSPRNPRLDDSQPTT